LRWQRHPPGLLRMPLIYPRARPHHAVYARTGAVRCRRGL